MLVFSANNSRTLDRFTLGRVVADSSVLHENDPAAGAGQLQPLLVSDALISRDAVVLRQSDQAKPGFPKQPGTLMPQGSDRGRDQAARRDATRSTSSSWSAGTR